MPSFNRLLVLAVVALSASVYSAPVADDVPRDLANVNGAIERSVPVPVDDFDEDLEARDFEEDLEERDVDDDDEDLEARDFEDDEDEDLESRDFDEDDEDLEARELDDEDSSALERRFGKKKTTKSPKPKATKTPKPKTTKAKTTKAKTTKAKTTKSPKPTATKPAKTTKAKTTKATKPAKTAKSTKPAKPTKSKPTKSAKPTKSKPTKSAKVTKTKSSKTTKASGTAKPSACPIKKPTKPTKKKTRMFGRAFDFVAHLFARDTEEFIGWHGTNSDTASFWAEKGQLERPVKSDGALDFLGLGPKTTAGKSGADAEIGPGVYITDQQEIAIGFANGNAKVNKGTTAQLCAIFAKSSSNWRTAIRKSFIPENLVGDSSDAAKKKQLEDARLEHVKKAVPGVSASHVVKFSLLNRSSKSGQLVLPSSITNHFLAKCFKVDGGAAAAGTSNFPAFSYNGQTLRTEWNIAAETAGECSA